jgi:hypothetical protein
VKWIWFGGVIVVIGTIVALFPNQRPVLVLASATKPLVSAEPLAGAVPSPARYLEGHD